MATETTATTTPRTGRVARLEPLLFALLALAPVIPVLGFRYFPNWDGPPHVATAYVFTHYNGVFPVYFVRDFFPSANVAQYLVLTPLVAVLSPIVAEKVLVAVIMVSFPYATRYALRAVRPGATPLAYLALPFAAGFFVHAGFYDFALGLTFFFLVLGFWLRHAPHPTPRTTLVLAVLLLATYLCHVVDVLMALGFVGLHALWTASADRAAARDLGRRVQMLVLAVLPTLGLALAFFVARAGTGPVQWTSPRVLLQDLVTQKGNLAAFARPELVFGTLLTLAVAVLSLYAIARLMPRRLRDPSHAFLVCAGVALVLYSVVPDRLQAGAFLSARLSLFPTFALLLWLAQFDLPRWTRVVAIATAIVVVLGLVAVRMPRYRAFNHDIKEFVSVASMLRRNSTVAPVYYVTDNDGNPDVAQSKYTRPVQQATSYLMAKRHLVDLSHYEAKFSYFPIHWRADVDPTTTLGGNLINRIPPRVHLLDYTRDTHGKGHVDYVLVWGRKVAPRAALESPLGRELDRQLAAGFRLVGTSQPRGLLEVYEAR